MMTVNSGNVITVDQNIQIESQNVAGEHDFNSDFMSCKLVSVSYFTVSLFFKISYSLDKK